MTERNPWDGAGDDPLWIDPARQARNAEERIVHALRQEGLIRGATPRRLRFVRPLALAATILVAFAIGTRVRPRHDAPPAQRAVDVQTTPREMRHQGEELGVAFHMVHPLDRDVPLDPKPFVERREAPADEPAPVFHLTHPLDGEPPEETFPMYGKTVQLASGS
jgi:hypothetical protein